MHTVLGAADALGEPLAVLLGDPAYYRRFGFELSTAYQITRPGRNGSRTSRSVSCAGTSPGCAACSPTPNFFDRT